MFPIPVDLFKPFKLAEKWRRRNGQEFKGRVGAVLKCSSLANDNNTGIGDRKTLFIFSGW